MIKAKKKTWGDEFQRHVSNGHDYADAAYRADEWKRIRDSQEIRRVRAALGADKDGRSIYDFIRAALEKSPIAPDPEGNKK